jgi:hypothetical protein
MTEETQKNFCGDVFRLVVVAQEVISQTEDLILKELNQLIKRFQVPPLTRFDQTAFLRLGNQALALAPLGGLSVALFCFRHPVHRKVSSVRRFFSQTAGLWQKAGGSAIENRLSLPGT